MTVSRSDSGNILFCNDIKSMGGCPDDIRMQTKRVDIVIISLNTGDKDG